MITTVCKISYGSQTVPPIVPAVQGDTGRAISFEIADFTPPAGATATYFILKPSGEAIYNSATITDNSILCELTAQSLAEAGENRMQVRVLQGEDIVTSFEVILMVRTFLGDDAIESGTEMNIFDQAVEQATEQFQENAEQIVAEVIESIPADYTELTEEVDELNERLDNLEPGLSDEAKQALLMCFRHLPFLDDDADYYGTLESALYPSVYPMITAVYNISQHIPCTADSLNDLKQYLTVTYYETESSGGQVLSSNAYALSGLMVAGSQTIYVVYGQLKASFRITVKESYPDVVRLTYTAIRVLQPYIYINSVSNEKRGTIVTDSGEHKIRYAEGTTIGEDSPYYAIPIPKGATGYQLDNSVEQFIRSSTHILHWDATNNAYFRDVDGNFVWVDEIVDRTKGDDVSDLSPFVLDVTPYNDGNYFVATAIGNASGRTHYDEEFQMIYAEPASPEGTIEADVLNSIVPHFLYD